jgi:hypothetical protein
MTKKDLIKIVDNYLKPLNYKRKGLSWYKENPMTVTAFTLDRSKWGGELYYVYLGVLFKQIHSENYPKFYQFDSNLRAEKLDEHTEEYLDLEKSIDNVERSERMKRLFEKSLPILDKLETIEGFKQLLNMYNPRIFMVSTKAQKFLNINIA